VAAATGAGRRLATRADRQLGRQRRTTPGRLAAVPVLTAFSLGVGGNLVELVLADEQYPALARAHAVRRGDARPGLNLDVLAAVAQRNPGLGAEAG